jgi:hypothetical protein
VRRRWEYLTFSLQRKVERKTRVKVPQRPPFDEEEEYWAYTNIICIWLPGAEEADERLAWSSEESDQTRTNVLTVLNELGAEGWELVSRVIQSNAMGKSNLGWTTAGWPIETVWSMKREID